jgi:hypothetical protein
MSLASMLMESVILEHTGSDHLGGTERAHDYDKCTSCLLLGVRYSNKKLHAIITQAAEKIPDVLRVFRGVEKEAQQTAQPTWINFFFS